MFNTKAKRHKMIKSYVYESLIDMVDKAEINKYIRDYIDSDFNVYECITDTLDSSKMKYEAYNKLMSNVRASMSIKEIQDIVSKYNNYFRTTFDSRTVLVRTKFVSFKSKQITGNGDSNVRRQQAEEWVLNAIMNDIPDEAILYELFENSALRWIQLAHEHPITILDHVKANNAMEYWNARYSLIDYTKEDVYNFNLRFNGMITKEQLDNILAKFNKE